MLITPHAMISGLFLFRILEITFWIILNIINVSNFLNNMVHQCLLPMQTDRQTDTSVSTLYTRNLIRRLKIILESGSIQVEPKCSESFRAEIFVMKFCHLLDVPAKRQYAKHLLTVDL